MVTKDGAAASFACCECMLCVRVASAAPAITKRRKRVSALENFLFPQQERRRPSVRRGDWKRDERKEEEQLLRLRQLFHSNRLLLTLNERA